jgi:hypothetical protein
LEEIFGATRLVLVLELRHALDQRVKLLVTQIGHQRSNPSLQVPPQCIQPTIHCPVSVESKEYVATSMPSRTSMTRHRVLS